MGYDDRLHASVTQNGLDRVTSTSFESFKDAFLNSDYETCFFAAIAQAFPYFQPDGFIKAGTGTLFAVQNEGLFSTEGERLTAKIMLFPQDRSLMKNYDSWNTEYLRFVVWNKDRQGDEERFRIPVYLEVELFPHANRFTNFLRDRTVRSENVEVSR